MDAERGLASAQGARGTGCGSQSREALCGSVSGRSVCGGNAGGPPLSQPSSLSRPPPSSRSSLAPPGDLRAGGSRRREEGPALIKPRPEIPPEGPGRAAGALGPPRRSWRCARPAPRIMETGRPDPRAPPRPAFLLRGAGHTGCASSWSCGRGRRRPGPSSGSGWSPPPPKPGGITQSWGPGRTRAGSPPDSLAPALASLSVHPFHPCAPHCALAQRPGSSYAPPCRVPIAHLGGHWDGLQ